MERICRDLDIDLLLPLRKPNSEKIVNEIIDAGFEAVVVSVKEGLLGKEWLGRRIDREFLKDLRETGSFIDPAARTESFTPLFSTAPSSKRR